MGRPLRIAYEGAIYHVMFRGNERRSLFLDDTDRNGFLGRLGERVETYGVRLYLFCLMSNHVHFLLETPSANISEFMRSLLTSYTNYFNARHRRSGHLTQGRFKSPLVEGDEYLLRLSRYIHLNPVNTAMMKKLSLTERRNALRRYSWSSYRSYVGLGERWPWVCHEPVLNLVGAKRKSVAYMKYIENGLKRRDHEIEAEVDSEVLAIGSESFREAVLARHDSECRSIKVEDRAFRRRKGCIPPERVLSVVSEFTGRTPEDLKRSLKGDHTKAVAAELLMRYSGLRQRQVAEHLGVTTGAAICMQRRKLLGKGGEAARRMLDECLKRMNI